MATTQWRPRWNIDDVLARTDLARLLDELATPARHATRGRRWHCPVSSHDDTHASVSTRTDHHGHERWRCWSGDSTHRGDAIDLVMITQHVQRGDAIDWLATRAGMIPDRPLPPVRRARRPPPIPEHQPLNPAVLRYARACADALWTPAGQPVLDWLRSRGFEDEVLRLNRVGADIGRPAIPRAKGLPRGELLAATFPAFNETGALHYLQARYIELTGSGKYDNPASQLGSNPRVAWTRPIGSINERVLLVCEGIPDALTAAQAGYRAVAILGSQSPDERVARRIANYAAEHDDQVVAIVHNDDAGTVWRDRLTELLAEHDYALRSVSSPVGDDLNDWHLAQPNWPTLFAGQVHRERPVAIDVANDLTG